MYCVADIRKERICESRDYLFLRKYKSFLHDRDIFVVDVVYESSLMSTNSTIYHTSNLDSAQHFFDMIYQNMVNYKTDNS